MIFVEDKRELKSNLKRFRRTFNEVDAEVRSRNMMILVSAYALPMTIKLFVSNFVSALIKSLSLTLKKK
jgi:hypothetical protein